MDEPKLKKETLGNYNIPGFGYIELIHNTCEVPLTSHYSAKVKCSESYEDGYRTFGGMNVSKEALIGKLRSLVTKSLDEENSRLVERLGYVSESRSRISICSAKARILDAFQVESDEKETLGNYNIPGFGYIELIHNASIQPAPDKYTGRVRYQDATFDDDFNSCGGINATEDELKLNVGLIVEKRIEEENSRLVERLGYVSESRSKMNICAEDANFLEIFKVEQGEKEQTQTV